MQLSIFNIPLTVTDIQTKPSCEIGGELVFENEQLLKILHELVGQTFTIEYRDELVDFRLPIQLGEPRHYLSSYETDFSLATGEQGLSSLTTLMFSGAGKYLRQIRVSHNRFSLYYGEVDWSRKENIEGSKSSIYFPYKDELLKSNFILRREIHPIREKSLKIPKQNSVATEDLNHHLTIFSSNLKVQLVVDDIISSFITIPIQLETIEEEEGKMIARGPNHTYLKTNHFGGFVLNPKSITGSINFKTGDNVQSTMYLHFT